MTYKVIAPFYDKKDGEYYYEKGMTFPRTNADYEPDKERFEFIEAAGFIKRIDESSETTEDEVVEQPKKRGRKKKPEDETEE